MPYRFTKRKKKAVVRKKRVYRRKRRVPRNIISLGAGRLPPRTYCKHRYSRQIRVSEPYRLNPITIQGSTGNGPCALIISCNSMSGILNQFGSASNPIVNPAFLPAADPADPSSQVTWDTQTFPNLFEQMRRLYSEYTVVGSKMRVNFTPTGTGQEAGAARPALQFVVVKTPSQSLFGSNPNQPGQYPSPNTLPSSAEEQPGSISKDWTRISNFSGKGVTLNGRFSTRKAFGKAYGNIVGESDLRGNPNAITFESLNSSTPVEQYYWQILIMPAISDGLTPTVLPPGIFNIDVDYSAVWSERQIIPTNFSRS